MAGGGARADLSAGLGAGSGSPPPVCLHAGRAGAQRRRPRPWRCCSSPLSTAWSSWAAPSTCSRWAHARAPRACTHASAPSDTPPSIALPTPPHQQKSLCLPPPHCLPCTTCAAAGRPVGCGHQGRGRGGVAKVPGPAASHSSPGAGTGQTRSSSLGCWVGLLPLSDPATPATAHLQHTRGGQSRPPPLSTTGGPSSRTSALDHPLPLPPRAGQRVGRHRALLRAPLLDRGPGQAGARHLHVRLPLPFGTAAAPPGARGRRPCRAQRRGQAAPGGARHATPRHTPLAAVAAAPPARLFLSFASAAPPHLPAPPTCLLCQCALPHLTARLPTMPACWTHHARLFDPPRSRWGALSDRAVPPVGAAQVALGLAAAMFLTSACEALTINIYFW